MTDWTKLSRTIHTPRLEDMTPEERHLHEVWMHQEVENARAYAEQQAREAACCVHRGVSYNDLSDSGCPACGWCP